MQAKQMKSKTFMHCLVGIFFFAVAFDFAVRMNTENQLARLILDTVFIGTPLYILLRKRLIDVNLDTRLALLAFLFGPGLVLGAYTYFVDLGEQE